ncbi:MAG: hypothetical protein EP318_17715 [Rhodobacteraceae bacterium]|nr:MAG: hypothetical protein EP318_17715 [Paracoccaceae bacterium]
MRPAVALSLALCLCAGAAAAESEFDDALTVLADSTIRGWAAKPEVLSAIRAQNAKTSTLNEDEILALDRQWRHETVSGGPLIDAVLSSPLSRNLSELKSAGRGRFTEIFVTDIRGLNVAQSDVTSDYWQGDEAKWQVPHDTLGIHIGDVEFDESAQSYQSQISLPVLEHGEFIGALTVGVDLEQLAAAY